MIYKILLLHKALPNTHFLLGEWRKNSFEI